MYIFNGFLNINIKFEPKLLSLAKLITYTVTPPLIVNQTTVKVCLRFKIVVTQGKERRRNWWWVKRKKKTLLYWSSFLISQDFTRKLPMFFSLSNILINLENKFLHLHKHNWNKTCYPKWCSCFQCTVISYQSKIISSAKTRRTQNELGANILYNSRKK